ncbi:MAG: NADH:flavin oxidoreductase [Planctomycetes bacterium]|nr:NADH:flavin oxidoreductase [Planctomycetota bacterium]
MSSFRLPATYGSVAEFRDRLQEIEPSLDCTDLVESSASPLAASCEIDGHTLVNRWAVQPMEGWDGTEDGNPTEDTLRRWYRFGLSGAALVWGGEAYAVCPEGRANPNQLHQGSCDDPVAGLKLLMAELRRGQVEAGLAAEDSLVGLQLTHSGRWSCPTAAGPAPRTMFRHEFLDQKVGVDSDAAMFTDVELQALPALYAAAAEKAVAAGFDFVDIKCCHGYLLHECLAATTRPGPYGGSFENRTRLFREIVAAVREACPGLLIGVRLSVTDELDQGFGVQAGDKTADNLEEPFAFLSLLQEMGIRLVNQTLGSPYYCPHVQRPAAFAPSDGAPPTTDPLIAVAKHLLLARRCKQAFPEMLFVGTGYTYLQEYTAHVAEHEVGNQHVDFVGLGRMMLSYPDMPADHLAGKTFQRKKICRTFSDCTTGPRNGMRSGCYPLDPEYRQRPEAKQVRALRPAPPIRK